MMKSIVACVVFVLAIYKSECHLVINQTKTEEYLSPTTENWMKETITEKKSQLKHETKVLITEEKRVYLEDVFHNLKSQNWSKDEEPCLNQTLLMLKSLQNFTLWAVWEWDSIASEPTGLLFGNQYQLGNFDECLRAPWRDSHPELQTQYCLANIRLERTDNAVKRRVNEPHDPYLSALDYIQDHQPYSRPLTDLTWGVCVPSSCQTKSVQRLLALMLARSHLGTAGMRPHIDVDKTCQKTVEPERFDGLFYSFFVVMAVLLAITLICTCLNCNKEDDDKVSSIKERIIKSFCLKANAKDLLKMKKEGIEVLYGIRFLTIIFIVMDHQIGMSYPLAIINGRQVDQLTLSATGMFIVHDDLFVDTFFLLSGFLGATNLMMFKRLPHPIVLIFRRYVRLFVAFAITVYYTVAVFPYTGSGPIWPRIVESEVDTCKKNWWISLLMLGNYIDIEHVCLVVTWYIPCDFHFFVISVVLFWLYKRFPRASLTFSCVVAVAAFAAPGIIVYINQLPAIQLFTFDFVSNPRIHKQFSTYIASHTRAAAYIVGFFSGCLFAYYRATGNLKRISQTWSIIGAVAGVAIMLMTMLLGFTFLWGSYKPVASALYAAFNRPVWAGGLALLVLCCSLGHVPLIKSFLSWYPWVPLSRLAYGLYLTHTMIILRNASSTRSPAYFDHWQIVQDSAGLVVCGCVVSFVIWLLAEAPANNLLAILLTPARSPKPEPDQIVRQNTSVSSIPSADNGGYIQENLPVTIRALDTISSKI